MISFRTPWNRVIFVLNDDQIRNPVFTWAKMYGDTAANQFKMSCRDGKRSTVQVVSIADVEEDVENGLKIIHMIMRAELSCRRTLA